MANNRVGAVDASQNAKNAAIAPQQAASIGATIGPDGWWYKDGKKLSHSDADKLVNAAGTGVGGNVQWGLGKGTLGDITGGHIGDIHEPGWYADMQRMAVEALGQMVGIPPQVTGAIVNNIGHGKIDNLGSVLKRGVGGALQGAGVGGAMQGIQGAGGGLMNSLGGAAKGAVKGLTHPFGSYTGGLSKAAPVAAGLAGAASGAPGKLVPDGKGGFVNAFGQPRSGGPPDSTLLPDGKGGFVNAFGQPRAAPSSGIPGGGQDSSEGGAENWASAPDPSLPEWLNHAPGVQDSSGLGSAPGVQGLEGATMPGGDPTAGLGGFLGNGDVGPPAPDGATGGSSPSWLTSLLGGLGGAAKGVGGFLTGNSGLNALALAQGANAAMLGKKSSDFADKAGNVAMGRWDQQAPLRTAGIAGMLNPQTPDLSGLTGIRQGGNPFAKPSPTLTPPPGPSIPPTGLG